jgi:hypothetical protein
MITHTIQLHRQTASDLRTAIYVFVLLHADKKLNYQQYYHLYIVRQLYELIEKRLMKMIYNDKAQSKVKLNNIQITALCDLIDSVQADTMHLKNFRLEIGKYLPTLLTSTP